MNAIPRTESTPVYRRLHVQVLIAMALGTVLGLSGNEAVADWVGRLGVLFVRLLKMVIVPLVATSIITGVVSIGRGGGLGRLGIKTLAYYMLTSLLAILLGLVMVNLMRPGDGAFSELTAGAAAPQVERPDSMVDILVRMIPTNPVRAAADMDMLGIIVFCLFFGVILNGSPASIRDPLRDLISSLFEVMMRMTSAIMAVLPLGVLGLITTAVHGSGGAVFESMGRYMATVAMALVIHLFVTLPLLLLLFARIDPRTHFRNMLDALLTAFSTSSSSATLPLTMRCVEERVGVSNRVTSFTLPLGATVNMDGTALYECVGVLFIAQVLGADLAFSQQMVVVFTALLASIGAAGVPSAGLVMIFIVLEAVNLRGPEVSAIVGTMLAVDRPLDMFRTGVNIYSDSCGAAIIAVSEGETEIDRPRPGSA